MQWIPVCFLSPFLPVAGADTIVQDRLAGHKPIAEVGANLQDKGAWMLSNRFMHMEKQANRSGDVRWQKAF